MTTHSGFSQSLKEKIDHWISKYPVDQKRSAVLPVLLLVQEHHEGWLTDELMRKVAEYLDMPFIAVLEVASFYSMLELKPVGKYKISVCTNISCMLSGCDKIVQHLKQKLHIQLGETTQDKKFTLKEVECLGACTNAPVVQIGHQYHEKLTPEKIDQLLDKLT